MKNLINEIAEYSIDIFQSKLNNFNPDGIFLTKEHFRELLKIHLREINSCIQGFSIYSNWTEEERWFKLFNISMDHHNGENIYYDNPDLESYCE
ncbi:MAG: hypothetical protein AM1032_000146 [Mycoplasmataceae bacterium]|nr:MAG: hypothetical protein AM1032_000146 [Mycoplasmataceae bacterium]